MRLLLDTHALLWWLLDDPRLPQAVHRAIEDGEVFVSAVSAIEVNQKVRIGKLPEGTRLAAEFEQRVAGEGFAGLPISLAHAAVAGGLAIPHKDPFDRLLIAQAQMEDMLLVSNEALFDGFGVRRLW